MQRTVLTSPGTAHPEQFFVTWCNGEALDVGIIWEKESFKRYRIFLQSQEIISGEKEATVYGLLFIELHKYISKKLGQDSWNSLLQQSGLGPRIYLASQEYPDEEMVSLISSTSEIIGLPHPAILEDFGEFFGLEVIRIYGSFINPEWKALDLIERAGELVDAAIRSRSPETRKPDFKCSRTSADEVIITYDSPRKWCGLTKGFVKGIAEHFNEEVLITETSCMLKGAPVCTISVKLLKS